MYHDAWLVPWGNVVCWSSLVRQEYVSNPTCKKEIEACSHNHIYIYIYIILYYLDTGLLARSQYSEGPATGHLDTGFSWFPCV